MNVIKTLGIDLAKSSFYLCGIDEQGREVLLRSITRRKLAEFIHNLPPCRIVMEACATSNYWGRLFSQMGHQVQLISPQHVKPYIQSQKNDRNDARGIVEAACRPKMKYVGIKTIQQQDLQTLHRIRQLYVRSRVAIGNQIRALLLEYGIYIKAGERALQMELMAALEDAQDCEMALAVRSALLRLYETYQELKQQIADCDRKLQKASSELQSCQRLQALPGVGVLTATLFTSIFGNGDGYKNGRQAAASIGLVPRQYSTGGRQVLLGITKAGKSDLRCLLVHGARSVLRVIKLKAGDPQKKNLMNKEELWLLRLLEQKGYNRTSVALANKNARRMFVMIKTGAEYKAA